VRLETTIAPVEPYSLALSARMKSDATIDISAHGTTVSTSHSTNTAERSRQKSIFIVVFRRGG